MREPTSNETLYSWYTNAMRGHLRDDRGTFADEPQCGWYKRRLVKNGPFVPARIHMVQEIDEAGDLIADEVLLCEVNGSAAPVDDQWIWLSSNPISESEYNYMCTARTWAAWHAPDDPIANPREPVDWLKVPTPTF